MSRVGRKVLEIPANVTITLNGSDLTVKGPKGELSRTIHPDMKVVIENNVLTVERPSDDKNHRALHGTTRAIIGNMVEGVSNGYTRTLELIGVGYRANKQGEKVVLSIGFSHPVEVEAESGITIDVPAQNRIIVSGINKERVGAVAANIRAIRPPEPYKGKGIRYEGEKVRRKEGKTAKK
jgi:large subunit ribosomal protein L6